jgi:magnesium chelatase subunit ChlD-like protein
MRSGFRWRQGAGEAALKGTAGTRIAWPRTLAAKRNARLHADHLRFIHQEARGGVLHCFVLDCSGSMILGQRLAFAKGLLLALFDQARVARSEVALVCFGGTRADVHFRPAAPRWWNERWIAPVGGGGGSPLFTGIETAASLLERAARRKPNQARWMWILTDGRASVTPPKPIAADRAIFVDFEHDHSIPLSRCARLAREWSADYLVPDDLLG